MRRFADLHVKPSLEDLAHVHGMIDKSAELGFHMIGLSLPSTIGAGMVNQLQTMCHDAGTELATRVDLIPRGRRELLNGLRKLRHKFEIVNVLCVSKIVARQAAKDGRVDLLSFPVAGYPTVFFDHAEAELASNSTACLEIDMQPLISLHGFARIRLLAVLRREVGTARSLKVPIIWSSGAADVQFLRKPEDMAYLGMLFGLDLPQALEALSDTPLRIVERNRQKLSPDYVAPGVRVIGRRD